MLKAEYAGAREHTLWMWIAVCGSPLGLLPKDMTPYPVARRVVDPHHKVVLMLRRVRLGAEPEAHRRRVELLVGRAVQRGCS